MVKKYKTSGAPSPVMGEGAASTVPATDVVAATTTEKPAESVGTTTDSTEVDNGIKTTDVDAQADQPQAETSLIVDFSKKDFPLKVKAINNTPIPLFLSEAGAMLAPNFDAPHNSAIVTFLSADHFAREVSNVEAIASAHDFTEALLFEELPVGLTQ